MMSGGGGFAEESSENVESSGVMTESGSGGGAGSPLQVVYFDYDQYNIRDDARRALQSNSDWMQQNPSSTVQIEGHCDERGTIEYNLALGERRANAAKRYIVRLGVDAGRLSTISYGEERPANSGSNEAAWSENRRAEFVILSQ
ncbi:MAG: peptidoglycan-associated lipoprotein Pal [Bdellovibrionaceae bacterium]|nr:peptidoglycan-associated lipoprotein Pal [Pseudobdellovibrionaceae bacterium]